MSAETQREAAARVIDPEAFEEHKLEAAGRLLAIVQWGARRQMALEAADRIVAAGYITAGEAAARVESMRERAAQEFLIRGLWKSDVDMAHAIRELPLTPEEDC